MVSTPHTSRRRTPKPRPRDPVRTKGNLLAAGCNRRMPYHYFGDTEGLYVAVLQAAHVRMEQVELRKMPDDASTADVICAMMARQFDFLAHDQEFVNLLMWENLNEGRLLARHPHLLTKGPVVTRLREVLEAARRRGGLGEVRHCSFS